MVLTWSLPVGAALAAILAGAILQTPVCGERVTIAFGSDARDLSTVIGLYADNGQCFHQRVDFSLQSVEAVRDPRIAVHAHVGSRIRPATGRGSLALGVRVNANPWHWVELKPYANDTSQWIEVPIPAEELRPGLNSVETDSTVASEGNLTERSLDLLASRAAVPSARSWHTHNLKSYVRMRDRNWGIQMEFDRSPASRSRVAELRIAPPVAIVLGEAAQFVVEARDSDGKQVDAGDVKWSTNKGEVDEWGLFTPSVTGKVRVTAEAGGKKARLEVEVISRPPAGVVPPDSPRRLQIACPKGQIDLGGEWSFRLDPANVGERTGWFKGKSDGDWGTIRVPGSWQAQGYGLDYHGVGWYRRDLKLPGQWAGRQVWLRFDAVATRARVWVNGRLAGEHLGDWTPFDLRITDLVRQGEANSIVVRVEELPGYFGAGFLPVIAPHFGGIWQPVRAFATAGLKIDDVFVCGDATSGRAVVETDLRGMGPGGEIAVTVTGPDGNPVGRATGSIDAAEDWTRRSARPVEIAIQSPRLWSPRDPALYTARVELLSGGAVSDSREVKFGIRDFGIKGRQVLLNGEPIYLQGILHWGYYPDLISIDPSEDRIRKEFADLKACGFNTFKACLFFMPRRFYEIADEEGMLIWQEYPVWQTFPKENEIGDRPDIVEEFGEWARFDRNHPSVVLRSLTCEAPSMQKDLNERVYKLVKSLTGGAPLEDNSAYLNQQITDWYDIHMYAETNEFPGLWSQHWGPALRGMASRPFIPGEDRDRDTYRSVAAVRSGLASGGVEPWWIARDAGFQLQADTEPAFAALYGADWPEQMVWRANRHAMVARKELMESYRKQPEFAGHTMTGIRDNMHTRCGFYDDLERPKWTPSEWRRFMGDTVLLLDSPRQSRCFALGEETRLKLIVSNYGPPVNDVPLKWQLTAGGSVVAQGESVVTAARGAVTTVREMSLPAIHGRRPLRCTLVAELGESGIVARNDWPLWFFPEGGGGAAPRPPVYAYSSTGSEALTKDLGALGAVSLNVGPSTIEAGAVIVTDSLDGRVVRMLTDGARVLYLAPDGDNTLPRRDAPFWREMAIWLPTGHPALGDFPHDGFVDLQFVDMTQRRPFDLSGFRDEVAPIIWGVSARYMLGSLVIVDYLFQARIGNGTLVACCLNLRGSDSPEKRHLLRSITEYAARAEAGGGISADGLAAAITTGAAR